MQRSAYSLSCRELKYPGIVITEELKLALESLLERRLLHIALTQLAPLLSGIARSRSDRTIAASTPGT